jgi:hypothetical protein
MTADINEGICRCRGGSGRVCDACLAHRQPTKPRLIAATAGLDTSTKPRRAQRIRAQWQAKAWKPARGHDRRVR